MGDEEMRDRTAAAFHAIVDTFTGADGGVSFQQTRVLIEEMDKRAKSGDQAAGEIIEIMLRFSRVITAAAKVTA